MPPLPVFPDNGLSNSVIPPVFIGLGISTVFAETLGWNFSGLIVPGYLAPIFIVKPISAIVIVIEAIISYLVLRLLSEGFSKSGTWTSFFGQDAFFALFCISILVKSAMEGPLLPLIGDFLNRSVGMNVDFRNEFHSTGLIIVPLMANIFWRHGFRRNLIPSVVVIGSTFLLTRFVLIPYTNFSVNAFELFYSKMATDFADSPQYYLILLMGSFLAARNKNLYGWSYHGMLIPALLGIAWLTPLKILTTFIEAGLIVWIGKTLVSFRMLRNVTIEGPRKLFFLFSIGFTLKIIAGFILAYTNPGFTATDVYGFAYILPSLIAFEMWTRGSFIKIARISIQTSFFSFLIGMLLSVMFNVYLPDESSSTKHTESTPIAGQTSPVSKTVSGGVSSWLRSYVPQRLIYGNQYSATSLKQLSEIEKKLAVPLIRSIRRNRPVTGQSADAFNEALERYGMELIEINEPGALDPVYILMGSQSGPFHGVFLFRRSAATSYVIEVPHPLTEVRTMDIGIDLFQRMNARALFISGVSRRKDIDEFDVTHLQNRQSIFQLMHQVIHREYISTSPLTTLQVRGAGNLESDVVDVLVDSSVILEDTERKSGDMKYAIEMLESTGVKLRTGAGNREESGYSHNSNAQYAYSSSFRMGQFASLWFSKEFREELLTTIIPDPVVRQLNWATSTESCAALLIASTPFTSVDRAAIEPLILQASECLGLYVKTQNIMYLKQLTTICEARGYSIHLVHESMLGIDLPVLEERSSNPARRILMNLSVAPQAALAVGVTDDAVRNAVYSMRMSRASALILVEDER